MHWTFGVLCQGPHAMKTNWALITGGLLLFIKLPMKLFMKCRQSASATVSLFHNKSIDSLIKLMDNEINYLSALHRTPRKQLFEIINEG